MARTRELRQRIKGVKNIEKITKAMKLVAVVKMKKAQEAILRARPYAYKIKQILSEVSGPAAAHPLLQSRGAEGEGRTLLVVVAADKGLCGSFNTNVIRRASQFLRAAAPQSVELVLIGKKARTALARLRFPIFREYAGIFRELSFELASAIGDDLVRRYEQPEFTRVVVIYNEFKSVLQQRVVEETLLPLASEEEPKGRSSEHLFEPAADQILEVLVPRTVRMQVFRILLESNAAELAARFLAMSAATKSAGEMIEKLTMKLNRLRQAGITTEILEVVSGAEALR